MIFKGFVSFLRKSLRKKLRACETILTIQFSLVPVNLEHLYEFLFTIFKIFHGEATQLFMISLDKVIIEINIQRDLLRLRQDFVDLILRKPNFEFISLAFNIANRLKLRLNSFVFM